MATSGTRENDWKIAFTVLRDMRSGLIGYRTSQDGRGGLKPVNWSGSGGKGKETKRHTGTGRNHADQLRQNVPRNLNGLVAMLPRMVDWG